MSAAGETLLGVVLAGGKSTRLGQDKACLPFRGQPLLCRVAHVLARVTHEIIVSGRDARPLGLDVPWLPDTTSGVGPAGGVATVLSAVARPCLIVSCDLPFLDVATLRRLVQAWESRPAHALMTTYRIVETGYIESLVAVYDPGGIELLRTNLARGERRLSAIFPESRRFHIDYSRDDPGLARAFFNINSPSDLEQALGMEDPA